MGALFAYVIQVVLVSVMLYASYKVFLSSATFHGFKRVVLLSIIVLSWLVPCGAYLIAECGSEVNMSGVVPTSAAGDYPISAEMCYEEPSLMHYTDLLRVILWVYVIGVVLASVHAMVSVWRILKVIRSNKAVKYKGYKLVVTEHAPCPFNWNNYIVLRPQDCDEDIDFVIAHELCHLRHRHWLDLIVAQINLIVAWFSPVSYLVMRELKRVHEFEADGSACGSDMSRYQLMLIKKTVGSCFPTMANSLNHSQIKIRITMMMKRKSNSMRRLAALSIPAMAAMATLAINSSSVSELIDTVSGLDTQESVSADKVTNLSGIEQTVHADNADNMAQASGLTSVNDDAENNEYVVMTEIAAKTSSEQDKAINEEKSETSESSVTDAIPAIFVDGKPISVPLADIPSESIKSMTIVKDDPAYPNGKIMIELKNNEEDRPAVAVEQIAEFKGGWSALSSFIAQNIKCPKDANGRVVVKFTVFKDGSVGDLEVMRGLSIEMDNEAVRVIKATSGLWTPARNNGKLVNSSMVIPVLFKAK